MAKHSSRAYIADAAPELSVRLRSEKRGGVLRSHGLGVSRRSMGRLRHVDVVNISGGISVAHFLAFLLLLKFKPKCH